MMNPDLETDWLSLSEAAEILGVHPGTVRNWSDRGLLPVYRTGGGHRRYKRNEVELWAQSQKQEHHIAPENAMQMAIRQVRIQVAEGKLESERWYQKLDSEARSQYRLSGNSLARGMMNYLITQGSDGLSEAHSIGYEYASRAHRYGLNSAEATQAYLFFRNTLIEGIMQVFIDANVPSRDALAMFTKLNTFADQILLALLETYEAFKEANQRR
jgi:excisionase family DNA binding protein